MPFVAFRLLFLLLALLPASGGHAALLLDDRTAVELAGHLEVLEAPAGDHDIATVASGAAGPFRPLPSHYVSGFGGYREIWLRFTLNVAQGSPTRRYLRLLPPYLDHADLYVPTDGGWQRLPAGDAFPFDARQVHDRAIVFPLDLHPGTAQTFHLHLRHDGNVNAYLSLYTQHGLHRILATEGLLFGGYFGIAIALLVINILHWFALREIIYAELSVYLLIRCAYFFAYNGYLYQFVLPDHPELARDLLQFIFALTVATTALFLVRILDMATLFPKLARFCYGLGLSSVLAGLTVWTGHFTRLAGVISLSVVFLSVAGTVTAFVHVRRKAPLGWLLLASMGFFMAGISLSALSTLGIHTSLGIDLYGSQVASVALFLALHFTVTMEVMAIRQAKAASDRAARLAAEMAERERAARREQSDFVAMLFHEIKNPLAVIDSAATVLEHLDDGSRSETVSRYDAIHSAVERLNLLVEKSLARDRQGLEEVYLSRRPTDLRHLARTVLESFHGAHRHTLSLDAPARLPAADVDPEFMRVALANLVDNAIKYAPAHSTIALAIRPTDRGELELSVSDRGTGMEPALASRAFDRYWRGPSVGGATGAGLGLYLVRRIVQAHSGSVSLETAPGQGCRFVLRLPQAICTGTAPATKK